jgi:hypothetical protein
MLRRSDDRDRPEAPMSDLRDLLDGVLVRAGFPKGRVRARMPRVTYVNARQAADAVAV